MAADTTSVPISRAIAARARAESIERNFKLYAWMDAAAKVFLELSPEQRAIAIATAKADSPSMSESAQSAESAIAKQVETHQIQPRRRRAG